MKILHVDGSEQPLSDRELGLGGEMDTTLDATEQFGLLDDLIGTEIEREAADMEQASEFLDLATIRRRVNSIKSTWTPATVQARAAEGRRRRREIENLLEELVEEEWGDLPMDCDRSGTDRRGKDQHGLSLVG